MTLTWPQPAEGELERQGDEVVVRFSRPLQYDVFSAALARLAPWVSTAFFGYDSMVLGLQPGTRAELEVRGGRVVIRFGRALSSATGPNPAPGEPTPNPAPDGATPSQLSPAQRLRFLKASLLWSLGEFSEAAQLLEEVVSSQPDAAEVHAALAAVNLRIGRWRLSTQSADRAAAVSGAASRDGLGPRGTDHVPLVWAEAWRDEQSGVALRDGLRSQAQLFLQPGLRVNLGYEYAQVTPRANTTLAGALGNGSVLAVKAPVDVSSHAASLALRYDGQSGSWLGERAVGVPDSLGVALTGELWDEAGATQLAVAWKEARLELPIFAAVGATRDSVGLLRTFRASSTLLRATAGDLSATLGAQLERWSADAEPTQVKDWTAAANLTWQSWLARPRVILQFGWQRFGVLDVSAQGPAGTQVLRESLVDSQFFSASLGTQLYAWRFLKLAATGAYAIGVGGQNFALAGAELAWQPPEGVRASLRYQYGASAESFGGSTSALRMTLGHWF